MGAPVSITRTDHPAAELRALAAKTDDADQARRLLAIAMVLDGTSRLDAARQAGMDRQTLRDWVHRYNALGLAGLSNLVPPGPPCRLSPAQEAEVAKLVQTGPDLAEHGVIRWRRIDLSRVIAARFGVHLAERSVGSLLRRLGFRRLSARPRHIGHDPAAQTAHKKTSQPWSMPSSPNMRAANPSNCGGKMKPVSANKVR